MLMENIDVLMSVLAPLLAIKLDRKHQFGKADAMAVIEVTCKRTVNVKRSEVVSCYITSIANNVKIDLGLYQKSLGIEN